MEGIEKALPQTQNAKMAKMIIKQLKSGEITLEEYLMKCAYWGVKTLEDIYYKSLPTKPLEVFEYEQLSNWKRQKLTQQFYVDNPGIMKYYEERRRVKRINKTNLLNMGIYKKYIPESDTKAHEKLDKKITDFRLNMEE